MTDAPGREALLTPHGDEHRASQTRAMARAAEPKTLKAAVRWVRWAYALEPPTHLHARGLGEDGTPRWSGDFLAWVNGGIDASCGTDADGYYRTPLRCALFTLHGRVEDSPDAKMADYLLGVASSDWDLHDVAELHRIAPPWVVEHVAWVGLKRLWDLYAPMPRAGT